MKTTKYIVTVGRVLSLAPYESLRIEVTEEYEGKDSPEERDKAVHKLSKRVINICAMEKKRHKLTLSEK